MQTFLPYSSFYMSARVLDHKRLGKQRVETLQIMTALLTGRGWVHHPATKMWQGYEYTLMQYQEAVCDQWMQRGYIDTCFQKTWDAYAKHRGEDPGNEETPFWLGDPEFHLSHQSNLVRKDPVHYRPLFPNVPDDLPYSWPV